MQFPGLRVDAPLGGGFRADRQLKGSPQGVRGLESQPSREACMALGRCAGAPRSGYPGPQGLQLAW